MQEEIKVEGLTELADALDKLPLRIARAAARPALNAGAQVLEAALHSTVPKDTGEMDAAIGRKIRVSNDLTEMSALVGPRYVGGHKNTSTDPGVRSKFLELGTRKMAPRFWMRRAFEMSKAAAYDATVAVLRAITENLPK